MSAERSRPAIVVGMHTAGLAVASGLQRAHVRVIGAPHSPSHSGRTSRVLDEVWGLPEPTHDEAHFIQSLSKLGKKHPGAVVLPTTDAAALSISRHREILADNLVLAVDDQSKMETMIDKRSTYRVAEKAGVRYPKTVQPSDIDSIEHWLAASSFPIVVKPAYGHLFSDIFGVKMFRCENPDELFAAYRRASDAGLEVMLQEFIEGSDTNGVNYVTYSVAGKPLVEFTAQKVRGQPPGIGSPSVLVSARVPEVMDAGRALLAAIGVTGMTCAEFKKAPHSGELYLMEINARHNLSGALAIGCGINFPVIDYDYRANGVTPEPTTFEEGIYWIDLLRDLRSLATSWRSGNDVGPAPWTPYREQHVYAVWNPRDPAPVAAMIWRYLLDQMKKVSRKALRGIRRTWEQRS